jgi:hypothetical protein
MDYKYMRSLTAPMRRQVLADLNQEFNSHQFADNMDLWVESKIEQLPELFDPTSPEPERFTNAEYLEFRKSFTRKVKDYRDDLRLNDKVPSSRDFQSATFDGLFYDLFFEQFPISPFEATKAGPWDFLTLVVLPEFAHMRFTMFIPNPNSDSTDSKNADYIPALTAQDRHYGRPDTRGRKVFERIWMRSQLSEGDFALLEPLSEDNFVGIFERSAILANRRLARTLLEAISSFKVDSRTESLKNSEDIVRDLMKRAVRLTSLHSINEMPIEALQPKVAKMLIEANKALGNNEYEAKNLFNRPRPTILLD